MIRSLRMRLFWATLVVTSVLLAILALAIDQAVHRTLLAQYDNVLLEKARSLASMVEQDPDGVQFEYQPEQFPEFEPGPRPAYFEVFVNGRRFAGSASLAREELPGPAEVPAHARAHPLVLPNGAAGRTLAIRFSPYVDPGQEGKISPGTRPEAVVAVAQDTEILDHTLGRIRWLTGLLCGCGVMLSGGALLLVTSRAVRPVRTLAACIESLDEHGLAAQLEADQFPTEIAPIVSRLNDLLARLQRAFTRERAFTADVAHELRTPLAGLLATLEVCRSRQREAAEYQAAIDKSLAMLTQVQALVERLLLLARAESGQLRIRPTAVDLRELLEECSAMCQSAAKNRRLGLTLLSAAPGVENARTPGDRELLRIVFSNLLENAISYADPGSEITIRISRDPEMISLEVANQGHGLEEADLPHLFERFWRKDAARTHTGTHAGLGLSLVQRLVIAHNGSITVRLEGQRFVARVDLPLAPLPCAPAPAVEPTP